MTPIRPDDIAARRVMVIAPHPDDESLGCGGLIAALVEGGREVQVVVVTDGGASHPGSVAWPRRRLAETRRTEALNALGALGLPTTAATFLDLPDADMPDRGSPAWLQAQRRLTDALSALAPDLLLLPWRRDPHRDHRDAWRLAMDAVDATPRRPIVWEYAIWLDELGAAEDQPRPDEVEKMEVNVEPWMERKRQAVLRHHSQMGELIHDDPTGFSLTPETLNRLIRPVERYWRSR